MTAWWLLAVVLLFVALALWSEGRRL